MDNKVYSISMRVHTTTNNNNNNKQLKQARLIHLFNFMLDGEKNPHSDALEKVLERHETMVLVQKY